MRLQSMLHNLHIFINIFSNIKQTDFNFIYFAIYLHFYLDLISLIFIYLPRYSILRESKFSTSLINSRIIVKYSTISTDKVQKNIKAHVFA